MFTYLVTVDDARIVMDVLRHNTHRGACITAWTDEGQIDENIMVCHGRNNGAIPAVVERVAVKRGLRIACCYPAQVQATHPNLRIMGDWTASTRIAVKGNDFEGVTLTVTEAV